MVKSHIILLPQHSYFSPDSRAIVRQIENNFLSRYACVFPHNINSYVRWQFILPPWYINTQEKIRVYIRTTQNIEVSGRVAFNFRSQSAIDGSNSFDAESSLGVLTINIPSGTPSGSIFELDRGSSLFSYGSTTKGRFVRLYLYRENSGPNPPQEIEVLGLVVPIVQDVSYTRSGIFVPPYGNRLPSHVINGALYSTFPDSSTTAVSLSGTINSYRDIRVLVPQTYNGKMWVTECIYNPIESNARHWGVFGSANGGSLTQIASGTISGNGSPRFDLLNYQLDTSLINLKPGDDLLLRFVRFGSTDPANIENYVLGTLIHWDTRVRYPVSFYLPGNGANVGPSGYGAVVLLPDISGSARWVVKLSPGQKADWSVPNIGSIKDQFRIRLRWAAQNLPATGINIKFSILNTPLSGTDTQYATSIDSISLSGTPGINEYEMESFSTYIPESISSELLIRVEAEQSSQPLYIYGLNVEYRPTDSGL